MSRLDWHARAACIGEDPDLFFTEGTNPLALALIDQAKAICARCPVAPACLDDALKEEGGRYYRSGIRGGTTGPERRTIRRRALRKQTPTEEPGRTLQEAVATHLTPTTDGHAQWHGCRQLKIQQRRYTPLRAAFEAGHGRPPEGIVRQTCGAPECHAWEHLADRIIREAAAAASKRGAA